LSTVRPTGWKTLWLDANREPGAGFWAALLVAAMVLTACSSGPSTTPGGATAGGGTPGGSTSASDSPATASAPATPAATVKVTPADGAGAVRPDRAVEVEARDGTLAAVDVTTKSGKAVAGSLSADQRSWRSTDVLAPGTKYRVAVRSAAQNGGTAESSSSFTTLSPKKTASVSIQPRDGWTVGVGMPVIIDFSRSVKTKNRDDVEKGLKVSTADDVEGAWRWFSSTQVQWRPRKYWPAHTEVKVTADLSSVEVAPGIWGSAQRRNERFTVGSSMVSTVDVRKHTMTVRKDGEVLRVIPVTTGKPGFASRNGTKVIMSRETSRQMDAATTGTDPNDPEYYNITVKYAMRLTYSGEFLHQAEWSVGSQGRANVSHGCTGMSPTNAKWLFDRSKMGDVVVYQGSSRPLEWGNGYTAWDMSYSRWKSA
jgi:lipoprotein-anchoring transpeptidase ErfK/SrfK